MTNHSPHTVPQPDVRAARIKADGIHALREATADQHHHLDRGLHDVLTHTLSMDRDGDLLAVLFGFCGCGYLSLT